MTLSSPWLTANQVTTNDVNTEFADICPLIGLKNTKSRSSFLDAIRKVKYPEMESVERIMNYFRELVDASLILDNTTHLAQYGTALRAIISLPSGAVPRRAFITECVKFRGLATQEAKSVQSDVVRLNCFQIERGLD